MSDATFPAGAGAPHDASPGHDVPGAPVCSEAERLPFARPVWMTYARHAGWCLARADREAECGEPFRVWVLRYGRFHRAALDHYQVRR